MIGMTVCSGIGAPEVSAPWIDWRYQSEIERFPSAVLAHRFPHARNLGDMTKFQEWPDATVDVLCGGTPCQSFSVAGLRKGLDDPRGNLMLTYLAIAARYRPDWIVWENVPGVLSSSGGRDFGAFLGGLGQLGYGFAYRVLDAQYVRTPGFPRAVPQRRRRVFVVGYLGDWRPAAAVLFDAESLRGHPAPRREAGQRPALTISARPTGGGGLGTDFDCDGGLIAQGVALRGRDGGATAELTGPVATALRASQGGGDKPHVMASTGDVAHCLNGGAMGRIDYESETMIAHALRGEGFDASEDGTGRGTPLVPVAFAHQGGGTQTTLGFTDGGTCQTLGAHQTPAVAFTAKDYGCDAMTECSPSLRAGGHAGSHANAGVMPAIATPYAVRRLTPRECERLQGFEDDWTLIPGWPGRASAQDIEAAARWIWTDDNRINGMTWDEALALARHPDGPRYKALGNSWAVNCGQYVFDGIRRVDAMMKEATA